MRRTRASTSEQARQYRQDGHDNAAIFAFLLGLPSDYRNRETAKKDVVDPSGDTHSIKSGQRKWQIFLYGRSRFLNDDGFQAMNGIGNLLAHCIDSFPSSFEEYQLNRDEYKERLRPQMRDLKDRLQRKALLRAFLSKAIFNAGEVDYLTVLDNDQYHVFDSQDVVTILAENFTVANSVKRQPGQFSDQKVVFQFDGKNVGEVEMRNDSDRHYRQIRFNMDKPRVMSMLYGFSTDPIEFIPEIMKYGNAIQKFGNWEQTTG